MSVVIRTRRTKRSPVSAPVLWIVLGLAAALFLVRYGQEVLAEHDLNGKIVAQQRANEKLDEENKRLEAALKYYLSDKYIEQRAREDLNLRRPDEEVLIPVLDTSGQEPGGSAGTDSNGAQVEGGSQEAKRALDEEPNWQKWLDLFSPFGSSP
jgi:cell division protein FtsB